MSESMNYKWYLDLFSPHEGYMHGVKSIPFARQTQFQRMEIMETGSYGRCLVLDGKMQSSEFDEFIYHEALVHPAMLMHPDPKRVFIVGGGEGATLREVLKHPSVEFSLMVDIDQEVVEACKTYLPEMHAGAFDDPRIRLEYRDARAYLEQTSDVYDVIIIDISEPVEEGPAYLLYTKEFYEIVKRRLSDHGVIALQAGTTAVGKLLNYGAVTQTLRRVFPVVAPYHAEIPSFGMPWGFTLATKGSMDPRRVPPSQVDAAIAARVPAPLSYYDGETHAGMFCLPKHIRAYMKREDRIIEDNAPLFSFH